MKQQMKRTLYKRRYMPYAHFFEKTFKGLRPGERLLLYILSVILGTSVLLLLVAINREVSVEVPARGGSITEGTVGTMRFVNPLLAASRIDNDLTELVFSGLTKTLADGTTVPNLASSYEISQDGKTYTFTLRDDITFHDGESVTATDVLFTVRMAQHPDVKSPRRSDWEGVSITSPDERTIIFNLPNSYAPFLQNTTLGILPEHLWKNIPPEEFQFAALNTNPIGSGPFQLKSLKTDRAGAITELKLSSFPDYALGMPHLNRFVFRFYPNEEALLNAYTAGVVDSFVGITPAKITVRESYSTAFRATLPRVFGIFFNQNHSPILADSSVRAALEASIDKQLLIQQVLGGFGVPLTGPVPPELLTGDQKNANASTDGERESDVNARVEKARAILEKGGWSFDETNSVWKKKKATLAFTMATADTPELVQTAEYVANEWKRIGVNAEVKVYTLSELNNTIIRPRSYDTLLFGEEVGRTLDLFAFWHSSQRNDPGLNLALYANTRTDSLLQEARAEVDKEKREKLYGSFAEIVKKDMPAMFLYSPEFLYVVPRRLQGITLGPVSTPEDRFAEAHAWYIDTERVWNIFTTNE